ncbi:MAG: hypothetical protein IPJ87_16825 [Flavobacteriales bacterium]|nr:hypothetical protein [Flavobacteriales bacterium]
MPWAAYAAKGERDLAEVHFKRCIEVAESFKVMVPLYAALVARGRMKLEAEDVEGAIADGRRGLKVSQDGDDLVGMIESTELLRDAFKRIGRLDSAFHFFTFKAAYDDSLRNVTNLNKLQNMAFEQELKDREDAKLKAEAAEARSRNIQFGIIALIVITLGIFLLVFSRTAVGAPRPSRTLSLIALLLFFEFINLLLHPFLDRITNHSPILMLLCMAAIAGLLIPLHHRMEKLITNMLVSKNNRVRLEAARRTHRRVGSKANRHGPEMMGMMRNTPQGRSIMKVVRLLCAVVIMSTIGDLRAQPFDTIQTRFSTLPLEELIVREKSDHRRA